jgi:uncharacterized protein YpmS
MKYWKWLMIINVGMSILVGIGLTILIIVAGKN